MGVVVKKALGQTLKALGRASKRTRKAARACKPDGPYHCASDRWFARAYKPPPRHKR
jgi:hypothetical protein